ncbi:MAG: hypothetical protein HY912_09715 [Desulfomonile tiedjei]|uniref:Lipoyl-binding domain-containing protein n=1 Tax=Desulfomonile tiedjei TaxID=2358 RepID=A0A9D6V4C1_9BACT|nr:hypothetical protein [Desulfomonile tiedjei]
MQYKIKIGDQVYPVETGPASDTGEIVLTLDGQQRVLAVRDVGPNQLHVSVEGNAANIFVARTQDGAWVWINGKARFVQDADLVPRRKRRGPDDAPGEVTPPTPASVVRVLVEQGQEIEKGQGCVVVSAMKMEITLTAPYSGTVKAVNTAAGAQVSPGEILVEIHPRTEPDQNE